MTAPDKLTVEQCDRDAAADIWLEQNGDPGTALRMRLGHLDDSWMVQVLARHRQQAEARAEGLAAALEKIELMDTDYTRGADHNLELARGIAREALTAYRSARSCPTA